MPARLTASGLPGRAGVWSALCEEALAAAAGEPALASLAHAAVLDHRTLGDALSYQLACKLGEQDVAAMAMRDTIDEAYAADPAIVQSGERDLIAAVDRDPACSGYLKALLFYKGFLALQTHRVAHWLWGQGRETLARHLQSRSSELFHVDIHPAARIGRGVFIDHGTGVVVCGTAVVGDDVSMLQDVTLGAATAADSGERHPRIGKGVLLSAGAQVLGDVEIGDRAKVAAGSLVLRDVPAGCTAVGVPARLVNCPAG